MKLLEKIAGKKKKCRACGEEFTVEPLSCPKCGARVKTHKAEKWSAMIGAFVGAYAGVDWDVTMQNVGISVAEQLTGLHNPNASVTASFKAFVIGGIIGSLFCFLVAFLVKNIILFVKKKVSR